MVTTKFVFTNAQIESAADKIYAKTASKYKVQGFRDGKAPRKIVEQTYGEDTFFSPAMSDLFNEAYQKYLMENPDIKPIDEPEIDITDDGKGTYTLTVNTPVQEAFALGKYKGLEIKRPALKVTDKDVDEYLRRLVNDRIKKVAAERGRRVAAGDIAVIDFVGYIDGKEFAGGAAKNHELEIGSHSFIDTFEEQIVGHAVGDKADIRVTFPKDYHAKEYAGKPAVFKIEVKNVLLKQIPEINDALAKESSEFNNLADFKKDIFKKLEAQAAIEIDRVVTEELLSKIADGTKVTVNDKIVERQYNHHMNDFKNRLAQNGLSLELYAAYNGTTAEKIEKTQREYAATGAKIALILEEISKKEKLQGYDAIIKFLKENNKC